MIAFEHKIEGVYHLLCPFGDCWTGITLVRGKKNYLIDSAGNSACIDTYLTPALARLSVTLDDISYLLITHTHADHIGGAARIKELNPSIKYVVCEESADKVRHPLRYNRAIRAVFPEHSPAPSAGLTPLEPDIIIRDGDVLGDEMQFIFTPGHDTDSGCWMHLPTRTLITGDSLQSNGTDVQGIGLYMDLPAYRSSLEKLSGIEIDNLLTGHHYLPLGYSAYGKDAVDVYLSKCAELVEEYDSFVKEKHREGQDDLQIAKALIAHVDGIEPKFMFLPLFTVNEHLKTVKN
ncbi:MAG: MBL fold metallo-hydrolase [Clostridia bacterium]|nr:MBL fold metallo-hydrolase [Clostridia bacterium]